MTLTTDYGSPKIASHIYKCIVHEKENDLNTTQYQSVANFMISFKLRMTHPEIQTGSRQLVFIQISDLICLDQNFERRQM